MEPWPTSSVNKHDDQRIAGLPERERYQRLFNDEEELEVEVQKIQQEDRRAGYERQLREDALCRACLTEQRKQRRIDDKTHNERLFELTIRDLVCAYCMHVNLAEDEDHTLCTDCGALQDAD